MVVTSVLRTVRIIEPPPRISVDDIVVIAERERKCHSARARRETIIDAHNNTYRVGHSSRSRPHTSASRYIATMRRETMTPKSIRSEPMPSRVSSRTGDYEDFEEEEDYPINFVSSPTPICCEVMGPQTCNECLKILRRRVSREQVESRFPSMAISHENITKATMLQRYFPTLTIEEIQTKLNRGEIARFKLPYEKFERERPKSSISQSANSSRIKQNVTNVSPSLFFVNIQHLNQRINSGEISRSCGFSYKPLAKKAFLDNSGGPQLFVSPRKQTESNKKRRQSFSFDPPLLAKRNQKPDPWFFAGSSKPYKLPEKLPDKIEFVENGVLKRSVSILSETASELSITEDTNTESVCESTEGLSNESMRRRLSSARSDTPEGDITEK